MSTSAETRRVNHGRGHSYLLDGARADSVTGALGKGYPKPNLIGWAADESAKCVLNHWNDLLKMEPADRYKTVRDARYQTSRGATIRGTDIHKLVHSHLIGEEISEDEPLRGHMDAYEAFLEDWAVQELLVEVVVGNRRYRYMGTLDMVARLADGNTWLLDWKTSGKGIFPDNALQLAAYRHAEFYLDAEANEQPMPQVDRTGCVWLRADGYDLIPVDAGPDTYRTFLYAQQLAHYIDIGETYIGEALTPPKTTSEAPR